MAHVISKARCWAGPGSAEPGGGGAVCASLSTSWVCLPLGLDFIEQFFRAAGEADGPKSRFLWFPELRSHSKRELPQPSWPRAPVFGDLLGPSLVPRPGLELGMCQEDRFWIGRSSRPHA